VTDCRRLPPPRLIHLALAGAALTTIASGGCVAEDAQPRPRPVALGAVAVGSQVAVVETTRARAYFVDPAAPALAARTVKLAPDPALAVARNGHADLLVLSRGVREGTAEAASPAELAVIPAGDPGAARRHPLASRFDIVSQSPDGRFAVLFFQANRQPDSSLLFNPNEVGIVDLDAAPSATASSRSLRAFGGVPQGVVFSPPLQLRGDAPRTLRLAVVLSDNYLTLLDLENDRIEISVALTRTDERRTLRPVQVLFQPGDAATDPTLFVRATGSADIVTLRLTPAPRPLADRANDFRPVLTLLGSGAVPTDMALIESAGAPRLFTVAGASGDAAVIDPVTSRATTFKLDIAADRIQLYSGPSPAEPKERPRAFLLASGGTQVAFLDLDRLEELRGRDLELRSMSAMVADLLPLTERGLLVAQHRGGTVGLSVVDLDRRTISPLVSDTLAELAVGPAGSGELWLRPQSPLQLGRLDLARLQAQEVRLDLAITRILPLAASADGKRYLAVDHAQEGGALTVVDAAKPERITARSLVGFLYTGLLEGGR
jgi:hypothetical protein